MFRFEHIEYLWLLLAVIPLVLIFTLFFLWRKRAIQKFGVNVLVLQLTPDFSNPKHFFKFTLIILAYVFIVLGFANPQIGTKQEKVKRQGIDVIVALDVSNSMLSEDVKPSRLARAKNFIGNFMSQLKNDRLGIIVFAGKAYMQMPLTVDYSAGRMYLRTVGPGMVPTQGTNIAEAINLAKDAFVKGETKHKALIIITDGEDNEGLVDEAISASVDEGVKIFTIGVGSETGSPIPTGNDFKRDESGNIVLSKLNQEMLKDIAYKGKGKFFMLGSGKDEIKAIFQELGGISTKEFEEMVFTDFDDQYQWCLLIAAILLLFEWWLNEKRSRLTLNLFK